LQRARDGRWQARVAADGFALALDLQPTQPVLLQGQGGYSRKGPLPSQASYYYSIPHLRVSGQVRRGDSTVAVTGEAWLDREWSSNYLAPAAQGWDWTGLNFDDGSALMAFREWSDDRAGAGRRQLHHSGDMAQYGYRRGLSCGAGYRHPDRWAHRAVAADADVCGAGARCAAQRPAGLLGRRGPHAWRAWLSGTHGV
jgi:hypothetical protein